MSKEDHRLGAALAYVSHNVAGNPSAGDREMIALDSNSSRAQTHYRFARPSPNEATTQARFARASPDVGLPTIQEACLSAASSMWKRAALKQAGLDRPSASWARCVPRTRFRALPAATASGPAVARAQSFAERGGKGPAPWQANGHNRVLGGGTGRFFYLSLFFGFIRSPRIGMRPSICKRFFAKNRVAKKKTWSRVEQASGDTCRSARVNAYTRRSASIRGGFKRSGFAIGLAVQGRGSGFVVALAGARVPTVLAGLQERDRGPLRRMVGVDHRHEASESGSRCGSCSRMSIHLDYTAPDSGMGTGGGP